MTWMRESRSRRSFSATASCSERVLALAAWERGGAELREKNGADKQCAGGPPARQVDCASHSMVYCGGRLDQWVHLISVWLAASHGKHTDLCDI